ncbi:MAG: hypothetical protein C4523_15140, partial [Myxococcales bacterium]
AAVGFAGSPSLAVLVAQARGKGKKAAPAKKSAVDALLEEDDSDLLRDAPPPPSAAAQSQAAPAPAATIDTVLLDINPVDTSREQAEIVYAATLEVLRRAEDLGRVAGKEALGDSAPARSAIRACRSMDNTACLQNFGKAAGAKYAIYGEARDMDDAFLLVLEMLDVQSGKVLESVRAQLPNPPPDLAEKTAEAACRLVRFYGCQDSAPAAAAAAAAPAPTPGVTTEPEAKAAETRPASDGDDMFAEDRRTSPAATVSRRMTPTETGGWALVGLAGAALVGGLVTTGLMYKTYDDYKAATTREAALDKKDKALTLQWTSIGLYGGAAALGGAAIVLLILGANQSSDGSGDGVWASPVLAPGATGLAVGGSF